MDITRTLSRLLEDFIGDNPIPAFVVLGFICGLGLGLKRYANVVMTTARSQTAGKSSLVLGQLIMIVGAFPVGLVIIPVLFDFGIVSTLIAAVAFWVAVYIGICIIFYPLRAAFKGRLKNNKILKEVIKQSKALHATYVICCYDGICIGSGTIPSGLYPDVTCKSKAEYDAYQEGTTSIYNLNASPQYTVVFAERGFPPIDDDHQFMLMENFCDAVKGFQKSQRVRKAHYTQPASYYTSNGSYYVVNGNLSGGPSTISTPEKKFQKTIEGYYIAYQPVAKPAPRPQPQKFTEQW